MIQHPVLAYELRDLAKKTLKRRFHKAELSKLRSLQVEKFTTENILRRQQGKVLVHLLGCTPEHDSWINVGYMKKRHST